MRVLDQFRHAVEWTVRHPGSFQRGLPFRRGGIGDGKALRVAGNPVKIGTAATLSGVRNPPALDQDRARLLAEFGVQGGPPDQVSRA